MKRDSLFYTVVFSFSITFILVFILSLASSYTKERVERSRSIAVAKAYLLAGGVEIDEGSDIEKIFADTFISCRGGSRRRIVQGRPFNALKIPAKSLRCRGSSSLRAWLYWASGPASSFTTENGPDSNQIGRHRIPERAASRQRRAHSGSSSTAQEAEATMIAMMMTMAPIAAPSIVTPTIGAGTNGAIESADRVLVDDDPADVKHALTLS